VLDAVDDPIGALIGSEAHQNLVKDDIVGNLYPFDLR
jgi:hypothetical protein